MIKNHRKWPEEVIDWMRENVPGRSCREVTNLINNQGFYEKYGLSFTEKSIAEAKKRYKIRSGTSGGMHVSKIYPEEVKEYILKNSLGHGPSEMTSILNERFGKNYSSRQIRSFYKNNNINSGVNARFQKGHVPHNKGKKLDNESYKKLSRTMFKKGHVPKNTMKIGEYTRTTDGYWMQKIKDTDTQRERLEFLHKIIWKKHNGPIPKGHCVIFLDGNKSNCKISNLALVSMRENAILNTCSLRSENPEITKAGIMVAKLKISAKDRKKGKNKDEN